jgi:HPt (histidine-containing phosphotransfer) domain-containing protein
MTAMSAATVDRTAVSDRDVIDRAHLTRMTLGDKSLEREVLQLFDRQSELLLARMHDAPASAIATLAHTLKGSARGIGAWRVAEAAEALEQAAQDKGRLADAYPRLAAEVGAARAAIAGR